MKKMKATTSKTYTEIVSEMLKKLDDQRKREKEILVEDIKETTKGKKIKIEGNLTKKSYIFS